MVSSSLLHFARFTLPAIVLLGWHAPAAPAAGEIQVEAKAVVRDVPEPLTQAQVDAMTHEEVERHMAAVASAQSRGDLQRDAALRQRLQSEFQMLMTRLRTLRAQDTETVTVLRSRISEGGPRIVLSGSDGVIASVQPPRAMIGIHLDEIDAALAAHLELDPGSATLVRHVTPGLAADAAGLRVFDVIVGADGERPMPPARLRAMLAEAEPGAPIEFKVVRKAQPLVLEIIPEAFNQGRLEVNADRIMFEVDIRDRLATLGGSAPAEYFSFGGSARPEFFTAHQIQRFQVPARGMGAAQEALSAARAEEEVRLRQMVETLEQRMRSIEGRLEAALSELASRLEQVLSPPTPE